MTKHVKGAKSVPTLPPRRPPPPGLGKLDQEDIPFPPQQRLIITTAKSIYAWDTHGMTEMFHSRTEGIVAAKTLGSDKDTLAVADSQVVVLHELKGTRQRSYRLKGSEVCALQYPLLNSTT